MTKEQQRILEILKSMNSPIASNYEQMQKELEDAQDALKVKEEKISSLESELQEIEDSEPEYDLEIECGIGDIRYEEPDNLQLQQLMLAFESAIKKHNPAFVLQVLETIS